MRSYFKQDSIPVGCVPTAAIHYPPPPANRTGYPTPCVYPTSQISYPSLDTLPPDTLLPPGYPTPWIQASAPLDTLPPTPWKGADTRDTLCSLKEPGTRDTLTSPPPPPPWTDRHL